jgi:hypothetical protein
MQDYVRSRLNDLKDEKLKNQFIKDIPEKSSGIFLWTCLAVGTIRNKMSHRASSQDLEQHLEDLPKGLESLFLHVLQSLEPRDAAKTLRLIDLLQTAKANDLGIPLLASSFIDEYDEDSEFSMRENIEALRKDKELVRAQLRGACGGLIESPFRDPRHVVFGPHNLDFIHRSVPDMFSEKTGSIQLIHQMKAARGEMNTVDVLSQILFAYARLLIEAESRARRRCESVIFLRLKYRIDEPPYHVLDYMTSWIDEGRLDHSSQIWLMRFGLLDRYGMLRTVPSLWRDVSVEPHNHLCLAAQANNRDYIDWKIQNNSPDLKSPVNGAIIGQTILLSETWELFFKHSVFMSDSLLPLVPRLVSDVKFMRGMDASNLQSLSSWQFFTVAMILQPYVRYAYDGFEIRNGSVLEMFLRQGADPHCQIQIAQKDQVIFVKISFKGRQSQHMAARDDLQGWLEPVIAECQKRRNKPTLDWDKDFEEQYSLREWLSSYYWPNRDTVLELMDAYDKTDMLGPTSNQG